MTLINAFKNPDASPSPRSHTTPDFTVTIGGQPITASRALRDEMEMRVAAALDAHRIAMRAPHMRAEREHQPSPGWPTGWVTSDGRPASDFPRVELTPHHPEHACSAHDEREDRSDLRQYRLTVLQGRLDALQRPLNAIANESASIARDGVGSWSREQVETLVRVSDLEEEVESLLAALRELF